MKYTKFFRNFGKSSIIAIFLSLVVFTQAYADFKDVPVTNQQAEAINTLFREGIIKGYPDGTFKPQKLITKAEFLKMVFAKVGFKPAPRSFNTGFKDIPGDSWIAGYIQKGLDLGVVKRDKDIFEPNRAVSRSEALRVSFPIIGISAPYYTDLAPEDLFKDTVPQAPYAYLIFAAKQSGILLNDQSENFYPNRLLTRGDAAELIFKIEKFQRGELIEGEEIPQVTVSFPGYNDAQTAELLNNPKFRILLDVWKRINTDYYYKDKLDKDKMLYGAIKGLIENAGDKYTEFEDPLEANQLASFLSGEFEGIGILSDELNKQLVITQVLPNSPAEKSGLKSSDIIKKIDGKDVTTITIIEALNLIRGVSGTNVKLEIERSGSTMEFIVTRSKIELASISSKVVNGNIGYISIGQFTNMTYSQFSQAVLELQKQQVKGFIIDLRNNPGGYVDSAQSILSRFVEKEKLLFSIASIDGKKEEYKSNGPGDLAKYPVAILINGGSASSAEILAGSLQDFKLATLIGEKSFGKGSVQAIINYTDESLLKITIAHWMTPLGRDINGISLTPDITITNSDTELQAGIDSQLKKAIITVTSKF